MPMVDPLLMLSTAQKQRRENARRARPWCGRYPRYRPYLHPHFVMSIVLIQSAVYLFEVHSLLPSNAAFNRGEAFRRGITTEQFHDEELDEIKDHLLPYTRFWARQYLEKECQKPTLWQQKDKMLGGDRATGKK